MLDIGRFQWRIGPMFRNVKSVSVKSVSGTPGVGAKHFYVRPGPHDLYSLPLNFLFVIFFHFQRGSLKTPLNRSGSAPIRLSTVANRTFPVVSPLCHSSGMTYRLTSVERRLAYTFRQQLKITETARSQFLAIAYFLDIS